MSILALAIKGLKRVQQQNQKPKAKGTTVNHNKRDFRRFLASLLFRQNQFSV
jgi:hypothetical protein